MVSVRRCVKLLLGQPTVLQKNWYLSASFKTSERDRSHGLSPPFAGPACRPGEMLGYSGRMDDCSESVHVHRMDADSVIEEYRRKGFTLKESTKPTIPAQIGFVRLVFVPTEFADTEPAAGQKASLADTARFLKFVGRKLKAD